MVPTGHVRRRREAFETGLVRYLGAPSFLVLDCLKLDAVLRGTDLVTEATQSRIGELSGYTRQHVNARVRVLAASGLIGRLAPTVYCVGYVSAGVPVYYEDVVLDRVVSRMGPGWQSLSAAAKKSVLDSYFLSGER